MKLYSFLSLLLLFTEFIACLTGFAYWKKWKQTPWKWFTIYLLFIVAGEMFGWLTHTYGYIKANNFFYNVIEEPIEFLTTYALIFLTSESIRDKRVTSAGAALYLVTVVIDNFMHPSVWFTLSYMMGVAVVVFFVLRFFLNLVVSNNLLHYSRDMLFWVATGWLLFYLGTLPYYGMENFLRRNYHELFVKYSYWQFTLNIAMYSLFTIGFVCGRPKSQHS